MTKLREFSKYRGLEEEDRSDTPPLPASFSPGNEGPLPTFVPELGQGPVAPAIGLRTAHFASDGFECLHPLRGSKNERGTHVI